MLRLARDPHAVLSLTEDWVLDETRIHNPWHRLVEGKSSPIVRALEGLGYQRERAINGFPVFLRQKDKRVLLLRHPLLTKERPDYQDALKKAKLMYSGFEFAHGNAFMAMRRPVEYLSPLDREP